MYTISFEYMRHPDPKGISKKGFPHGVVCAVESSDSDDILLGYAYCHPTDQFCRATGKKLALTRAIEELPRETRREVWRDYHNG